MYRVCLYAVNQAGSYIFEVQNIMFRNNPLYHCSYVSYLQHKLYVLNLIEINYIFPSIRFRFCKSFITQFLALVCDYIQITQPLEFLARNDNRLKYKDTDHSASRKSVKCSSMNS